jgi:hypothetical protein
MAMVQCRNGHTYDDRKHTHCPYCPVPGLKDVTIPGTQAAPLSRPSIPQTEPASPMRSAGGAGGGAGSGDQRGTAGVTVGIFQKHMHMEPVVGWLVCIKGTNKGRDYRLHSDMNKLGRAPNMDVCIEGDDAISRENHCQIAYSPRSKTFTLIPGGGRNLIYLNNDDVFAATKLQAYDRLDLGDSRFIFIPLCTDQFDWGPIGQEDERSRSRPPATPDEGATGPRDPGEGPPPL